MSEIALPAFHVTTTRKVQIELSHELASDLDRYKMFYKQAYNADVAEPDLVREMARRFMEATESSKASRRRSRPSPAVPAGPYPPRRRRESPNDRRDATNPRTSPYRQAVRRR